MSNSWFDELDLYQIGEVKTDALASPRFIILILNVPELIDLGLHRRNFC